MTITLYNTLSKTKEVLEPLHTSPEINAAANMKENIENVILLAIGSMMASLAAQDKNPITTHKTGSALQLTAHSVFGYVMVIISP